MRHGDDDAGVMFRRAEGLLYRAAQLEAEAREWMSRAAHAGSLDAIQGLVRLAVADGDYRTAFYDLGWVTNHQDVPAERWVTVAPGVLGAGVSLDGDDVEDVRSAGTFTVVTPWVERAAAVLDRVSEQLMNVDEHGNILAPGELPVDDAYTPNFVFDPEVSDYATMVKLDTKGVMFSAMGRTMVGMIAAALAADRIPAHITSYCPDLDTQWRIWQPSGKDD